jgi:hypothetical protein
MEMTKIRHGYGVAAVLALLVASSVLAQHRSRMGGKGPTFEVESGDGVVSIPFELNANHLIFPIRVQETTFRVILDTGMPMSGIMLYETEAVKNLDLSYGAESVQIGGAGGSGRRLDARLAHGVDVEIGAIRMNGATAIIMPPLPHFNGSHDGVIGYGLFKNFVVQIDNDRNVVEFRDAKSFSAPESSAEVPLEFLGNFPYTDIVITTDDDKRIPLNVVIDLGAGHPISLNVNNRSKVTVPSDSIRTIIGKGVGGTLDGHVGRIQSIDLGGQILTDVVSTFPDRNHQRPGGMDDRNGNLGNGILRHFNVTFDYSRKVMLLEQNKRFAEPFEWDMSGMRLTASEVTGLRIEALIDNSPAAKAGLAIDDVVTHVNGKAVSRDDVRSVRKLLEQEGAEVRVSATRDGRPLTVKLRLRRLV